MSHPLPIQFQPTDLEALAGLSGRIVVLVDGSQLSPAGKRLDRLMRGALARCLTSDAFKKLKPGEAMDLAFPAGLAADAVQIVALPLRADTATARKAGAAIGRSVGPGGATVLAEARRHAADLAFGLVMRAYEFTTHKTAEQKARGAVTLMCTNPERVAAEAAPMAAVAEGVFFTRNLVSEPANVLTTHDFAARLAAMQELGLDVEIL